MKLNNLTRFILASAKRDKKNIKTIKVGSKVIGPDDLGQANIGNISGWDDGDTTPDTPSAGADYYAGSLADGEITDRNLLAQVTSDAPNKSTKVTFVKDVGAKVNMVGDGITILGHISKVPMTKGVLGTATTLPLNYDLANNVKDGYFTTTSPYCIYIKQADIVVGKKLEIPINGVGEGLSGKNVKAAKLFLTFNADNTVLIEHETGYDNDGDSAGATGANYDFIVDTMATFSTQNAVAQLPASVNLFSGSSSGDIALSGISEFFENSMDGIELTLDNYIYEDSYNRIYSSDITSIRTVRIPKEYLINGNSISLNIKTKSNKKSQVTRLQLSQGTWNVTFSPYFYYMGSQNAIVTIGKSSINSNIMVDIRQEYPSSTSSDGKEHFYGDPWSWKVLKITPYKN